MRVEGLGFGVWFLGFGVWGLGGFRVYRSTLGFGFRVDVQGFGVRGSASNGRVRPLH